VENEDHVARFDVAAKIPCLGRMKAGLRVSGYRTKRMMRVVVIIKKQTMARKNRITPVFFLPLGQGVLDASF
jgi:hypothetical protein